MDRNHRMPTAINLWLVLGLAGVLLTMLPCFLLGEDAVYIYLDQLDGEMIAYILQAKHLFQGNSIAEFMNGASRTALTVPAPLAVLLFLTGNNCGALFLMGLLGKLCGYAGMYLLVRESSGEKWIAALTAFLYSCIPFLAVYGLAEFGIPMLFWAALQMRKGRHLFVSCFYFVLYALCSSLVLVGFGVLGMGMAWILLNLLSGYLTGKRDGQGILCPAGKGNRQSILCRAEKGKRQSILCRAEKGKQQGILRLTTAWLLLLAVYLAENQLLLRELLGIGGKFITHKSEYALGAQPFIQGFITGLFNGVQHGEGYHLLLLACICIAVIPGLIRIFHPGHDITDSALAQRQRIKPLLITIGVCLGWNVFFALLSALWNSASGISLRSHLSFLGAFQLNRLLWLSPCLWYLAAACGLSILYKLCQTRLRYVFFLLLVTAAFGMTALWSLYSGEFKLNLQKLKNPGYEMLSYRDYYAIGVMEQVRDFLNAYTGKGVDEYRVVSLGIDPAAALYHGFYCLDEYSNNYSLDYKMQFREVISPELEKSEYLRQYYDGWGNRCYLFSSECPGYYTIEKHQFYFQDYHLNAKALYDMGGRYLLSAAYISNAEEQGLTLLNETPFETDGSYYAIYIYEISIF
ncbi:MAG: hypothetical protein HFH84_15995 [Lachnospiraceae bacterium]|nr:hypothetical protein [Lachnospiraceae bacterium]